MKWFKNCNYSCIMGSFYCIYINYIYFVVKYINSINFLDDFNICIFELINYFSLYVSDLDIVNDISLNKC